MDAKTKASAILEHQPPRVIQPPVNSVILTQTLVTGESFRPDDSSPAWPKRHPDITTTSRQRRDTCIDRSDCLVARVHSEQLLDVPLVLASAGIELQQNEICTLHDGRLLPADDGCASQDFFLPSVTAYDDIDNAISPFAHTHDAGKGIIAIAASDIDRCADQRAPETRLQHPPIVDEEILIERRPAHAMHGQGSGADEGVGNRMFGKDDANALEQRHNVSGLFEREGSLPTARARLNTRRASASLTPCAIW
jgi:hypothetical protein